MLQLTLASHAEVKVGFFTTEVIGDFPKPEACEFFQGLLSSNQEITDTEWTSVFEVRHWLLPPVIWVGVHVIGAGADCCIASLWRQRWLANDHRPVDQKQRRC